MRTFFTKLHNFFLWGTFALREPVTRYFDIDDLFEEKHEPWWTKVYWAIRRFWHNSLICSPRYACRKVKWFVQRGRRGWADCDTWGLDNYLTDWMPDALRHLKKHNHGIPYDMFDSAKGVDETGNPTEGDQQKAEARWNLTMDKMIAAFEANRRMSDGLYEEELGEYPIRRVSGVSREAAKALTEERYKEERKLVERDRKIWEEGAALFVAHFNSLWD